jgi:23S rRNA (guanosine2251-2'-O)-methyltransferase
MAALNEDALKTSAGALAVLQLCRVSSLPVAIALLRLNGILVYASAMDGSQPVFELDYRLPCCLVFGSEEKGVQSGIRQSADSTARIPMAGSFNSFNVSVAAGIFLYEAMKQRG